MNQEAMNCKTFRSEIDTTDDPIAARPEMLAHTEMCGDCYSVFKDRTALHSLLSELTPVVAPNDFEWRLRARLQAGSPGTSGLEKAVVWLRRMPTATALITLLMLIVALGGYLLQQRGLGPQAKLEQAGVIRGKEDSSSLAFVREWSKEQAPNPPISDGTKAVQLVGESRAGRNRPKNNLIAGSRKSDSLVTSTIRHVDKAVTRPVVFEKQFDASSPNDFSFSGIALDLSSNDLKVRIPGAGGLMQTVSLRTVTFGSQQILDRPTTLVAGTPNTQGIW